VERPFSIVVSVHCLNCGVEYAKPTNGGTVKTNPGCPRCGYLGWTEPPITAEAQVPRRFSAGRPRDLFSQSG